MSSLTSLFLCLVIGALQQGLGLFESSSIRNRYLEVIGTIVADPAHIACEAFFQFHGVRAKLQIQNDFVFIYLNASKILRFLICKVSTYQFIDMYKAYSKAETGVTSILWLEWIARILLIIVALYGTVTTFLDGKFTVHRLLNTLERKVYDFAYKLYERQAKEWDI